MQEQRIFKLRDAGREATTEYLLQRSVSTGNKEIDEVLEGGVEAGNYYLWLGSAKAGKSTTLRCLGMKLAETFPVLYINFEQLGRNVFAKIYQMRYGKTLREEVHRDLKGTMDNIARLPDIPFHIAFWPDSLTEKSFSTTIKPMLLQSVKYLRENDKEKRTPVIILENLSDCYNERLHAGDNITNIVTQTAQDIKNFNIQNETVTFLAHHSAKLQKGKKRPELDDVRDSKRVVDLAHSIFVNFVREDIDEKTGSVVSATRHLAYLAGRGSGEYREWEVHVRGLELHLT